MEGFYRRGLRTARASTTKTLHRRRCWYLRCRALRRGRFSSRSPGLRGGRDKLDTPARHSRVYPQDLSPHTPFSAPLPDGDRFSFPAGSPAPRAPRSGPPGPVPGRTPRLSVEHPSLLLKTLTVPTCLISASGFTRPTGRGAGPSPRAPRSGPPGQTSLRPTRAR